MRTFHHMALRVFVAALVICAPAFTGLGSAAAAPDVARALVLEGIELDGATRTSLETVLLHTPLRPGQPIDQTALIDGVAALRASRLFADVDFFTRPGSSRGRLVLVLEVTEHRLDFRWAAGNTDLDGWYLVPAMVALDNATGRGDFLDLQFRFGFRHQDLRLQYVQPRVGDGRDYWGTRLSTGSSDRSYFDAGVEYRHEVKTGGLATVYGRRFSDRWLGEVGLNLENVEAAAHSRAYTNSEDGTIAVDDVIRDDDLPDSIRDGLGRDGRAIVHLDLQHDTRSQHRRAGSPASGLWGRLKVQGTLQGPLSHVGLQGDLRAYREAPGGVFALRLRGSLVTENAPWYDRLYLGGMYTVRGFPTHSLSGPGGDTWLWSGSVEHRSRILGDARGTKLAGVLFMDAGASGTFDGDALGGVAVGAGYGLRLRVWWFDWIGVDVGFPLTKRPLDQRFQVTASIGWSF